MSKSDEQPLYPRSADIRAALDDKKKLTKKQGDYEKKQGWGVYSSSMRDYVFYFGHFYHPEVRKLLDKIQEWKTRTGKPVVALDIAGLADGKDIGVDYTINIVLEDPKGIAKNNSDKQRTILIGDITSSRTQHSLLSTVDAAPAKPLLIFFRPVGAFSEDWKRLNTATEFRLMTLFKNLYDRLDDEGEMLVSFILWPRDTNQEFEAFLQKSNIQYAGSKGTYRIYKERSS